ncbi:MAG: hypothetical protein KAH64_01910 [Nitrosomonadaceae bacterium]|nr:hypothetical protein [Nitrosomonadaceae bacterium]
MTVSSDLRFNEYVGNGTTDEYVFLFQTNSASWVQATVDGVVATGSIALNLDQESNAGGIFTFDTPPANGSLVVLQRLVPETQNLDLPDYTPFPARQVEDAFDKIVMALAQYLNIATGGIIDGDISILKRLIIEPSGDIYFSNSSGSTDPNDNNVYKLGLEEGLLNLSVSDGAGNFNPMITVNSETVQFLYGLTTPAFPDSNDDVTNKGYVDAELAQKVDKGGDTMQGPLNVADEPASGSAAVNKNYVFELISGLFDGLQFEGFWDASTGTLPTTTENGDFYVIAVDGTLTVSDGLNAPTPTPLIKGDKIVYSGANSWWVGVTTGTVTAVGTSFNNAGTNFLSNDVQNVLVEADSTLFAHAGGSVDEDLSGVKTFNDGINLSYTKVFEFLGTSNTPESAGNYKMICAPNWALQRFDGSLWRTAMQVSSSGQVILHDPNGSQGAKVGLAGTALNDPLDIVTQEKGDERYAKWYATEAEAQADTSGQIVFADAGS